MMGRERVGLGEEKEGDKKRKRQGLRVRYQRLDSCEIVSNQTTCSRKVDSTENHLFCFEAASKNENNQRASLNVYNYTAASGLILSQLISVQIRGIL